MKKTTHSGFTLIEVALSLGIIGFAMVALMGMLPIGLSSFHDAKRETVDARIVQQLSAMLQLSDWSNPNSPPGSEGYDAIINSYGGMEYYFDSYGNEIGSSAKPPANTALIVYTAQLSMNNGSGPVGNVTLPGASDTNAFLRSFTVLVTDLPSSLNDRFSFVTFPQLKYGQNTLMYTTLISQSSGA